ncbi:hypothetical protein L873DRAFT_1817022 [Choiromyces venosus 120613-1]|uniref:Uncharacterized protein n=1 Tax=Choiromyces venosus 120613-1 TaxID=1336337 RepID=A0A3N4J408_9PEZI|nr:hypothetical protein L873DRAFT_1817022 [Choiromyces venosus 120613-1]
MQELLPSLALLLLVLLSLPVMHNGAQCSSHHSSSHSKAWCCSNGGHLDSHLFWNMAWHCGVF